MEQPSICIFGAGAIGLDLAGQLLLGGRKIAVCTRGATFEALRTTGIVWTYQNEPVVFAPERFTLRSSVVEARKYDLIFLTTGVEALEEIAPAVSGIAHPGSVILSATNGIPPWYSLKQDTTIGRFEFSTAPREAFSRFINPESVLGVVVGRFAHSASPGVVSEAGGSGYTIGTLDHQPSARVSEVQRFLAESGITVRISDNIHRDIWLKLIGNVATNPLSVLTEKNIGEMLSEPATEGRMRTLCREVVAVGVRLGVISDRDFNEEAYFTFLRDRLSEHRTSMLRHFQTNKRLEIDRIIGAVRMLAVADGPAPAVNVPAILELESQIFEKLAMPE